MAKKLIPYVLVILLGVVIGWAISGGKDDKEGFEKEREGYERVISDLNHQIAAQDSISGAIRERMTQDSIQYADALKRKETAISKLKNDIAKTDYRNFGADRLDSVRAVILSRAR